MRETSSGKISVIIPVRNAEKYIEKAVRSVMDQSYTDWEMFLIESGSEDASLEVCKKLAGKEQKIHVIEEENRGIGSARNTGLRSAAGEYIVFIDADDHLPDQDVFQRYINITKQIETDIIVSNYVRLWNGKFLPAAEHDLFSMYSPDSEEFRFRGFFSIGTLSYVWGKLYRKSFLEENDIVFSDFEYAEDKLFNLQCYINGAGYTFLETVGYTYRKNDQSVSYRYKEQSSRCWLGIAEELEQWIEEQKEQEKIGTDDRYETLPRYIIFFAAFFDAKMEYVEHKKSLWAVWKMVRLYGKNETGRECFQALLKDPHIRELSQVMWKMMIRGFAFGMKMHFFAGLSLGIKLLIDLKIDELLSDTGLRGKKK